MCKYYADRFFDQRSDCCWVSLLSIAAVVVVVLWGAGMCETL